MTTTITHPPILWKQVLGLTALQSAIGLMWVTYSAYLPQLLGEFGLPAQTAGLLLIVESALSIVLEPLMGRLSDRARHRFGTGFPFIAVGVILSGALFLAIPALAFLPASLRNLALFVLIAWAAAMTIFRSPALALLRKYGKLDRLPIAASLITLTTGLIGTTQPFVNQALLRLGALPTFAIGSFLLLGTTAILRSIDPPEAPIISPPLSPPRLSLMTIAAIGLCVGFGNRLLMDAIGKSSLLFQLEQRGFLLAVVLAVLAVPAGFLATKLGVKRSLRGALLLTLLGCVLLLLPLPVIFTLFLLIPCLSLIANSVVPFAIATLPPETTGFGVGLYFAGFAAAATLFAWLFPQPTLLSPLLEIGLGAIAFAITVFCVTRLPEVQPSSPPV